MGDHLRLSKEKRHRSTSSIAGSNIKNTCSERKVNIKVSIPEVDDQFAMAESRCNELKSKIDLVKNMKRKRKLKKRSMTRVAETLDAPPFISVQTQPKIRMQTGPRLRCGDTPPPPPPQYKQGYVLPAAAQKLLGPALDYGRTSAPPYDHSIQEEISHYGVPNIRLRKKTVMRPSGMDMEKSKTVCEEGDATRKSVANMAISSRMNVGYKGKTGKAPNKNYESPHMKPPDPPFNRRKNVVRDVSNDGRSHQQEDRSVVELFSKKSNGSLSEIKNSVSVAMGSGTYGVTGENEYAIKERGNQPRRVKYRSRRYELPTVASQMKQAASRLYNNDYGSIPFIISKSTAPSHNIAVNIQQVLNGFKNQQPLNGIPLTMAFHMGLGHVPDYMTGNVQPLLENRGMNAIRLGRRLLRLPDKLVSFNRLLTLYREGDGVVSRFLRAINRPQRFYTSMYNLATRDEIGEGVSATKIWKRSEEAKRNLAIYASLYREFQMVENNLKENPNNPELLERKHALAQELSEREENIRKSVLQEHPEYGQTSNVRATASTADDTFRFSSHRINSTKL